MNQVSGTYYIWIGGSCDYGHKERAGAAAAVIELDGKVVDRKKIADLHTTEFRMMLTLIIQLMDELPEASDIVFLTNAAYIQNFDREPGQKSANPDLIRQCNDYKSDSFRHKYRKNRYYYKPWDRVCNLNKTLHN